MSVAKWRKCDFQIHTPRDPNWTGNRPAGLGDIVDESGTAATTEVVQTQRLEWAREFVASCASRGLEAIAITDHNEMVMVPYVQQAIAERKEGDDSFDLWLFPGMELTARGGMQGLIIFDADLSEDWRKQAQGTLGITYANLDENSAVGPTVTQVPHNYADIGGQLEGVEDLKGKYIYLPNVSQGNSHTVLTDGAHADFLRMPYIGGYLDQGQTIDTLRSKNRRRLSGDDEKWSEREIYPIPTSDSRSADYKNLGQNNTWIKLAEPTAEAIRQAFLGHKSRIRITPPQIPSLAVVRVEVQGSTIIEQIDISLSSELNSIIGGRGSGKSSFLEYIAFGLGRSCFDQERDQYSGNVRMQSLINETLVTKSGSVTLTVVQDNAEFKISRSPSNAHQPVVTYPDGSEQSVNTKELRTLFPAVVYCQGELSEIGKQTGKRTQLSDLLQFVNLEYKREDDQLISAIGSSRVSVKDALFKHTSAWSIQAQLRRLSNKRDSLKQRVEALEKTLPALSPDDKAIIEFFEKANEFESERLQASSHADTIIEALEALSTELLNERELGPETVSHSEAFKLKYHELYEAFEAGLEQLKTQVFTNRDQLSKTEDEWELKFKEARSTRDSVLKKLSEHTTVTGQITKLKDDITELTNEIGEQGAKLASHGDPTSTLQRTLSTLREVAEQRATRIAEWAKEIERLSSKRIKATIDKVGDISEIKEAIESVSKQSGSKEATRIRALDTALESQTAWEVVDHLRTECLALLHWRELGIANGDDRPETPLLKNVLGDTDRIKDAITDLMDVSRIEAIATAIPSPEITLSYCDESREISFEKASEGQRAAALLFMLLEQNGGPLVVDQPEGDLDNKIITDLTEKLHNAKQNRQILFASHNANIVVNGSSELVGHLEVKDSGGRNFDCTGAIDEPAVCDAITSTMEGGEKAFKDRQDKYGY